MIICVADDRKSCEVAVKLLLLSLTKHCRDISVELFFPPADDRFRSWLLRCPQANLNVEPIPGAYGWNVKPQALLVLLDRGYDDIVWIDSDILVTRDLRPLFASVDANATVLTEEALYGSHDDRDGMRARLWGFKVGRTLPFTANTGVMRVTRKHIALLERWRQLLECDVYRSAQRLGWPKCPVHMVGDQDVLTALLASTDYADVPIRFLRRGRDIVQYFGTYGYTCAERIGNLLQGPPAFVHSQGSKPWSASRIYGVPRTWREHFFALYLDLSPYTLTARKYQADLEVEDCGWMQPRSHVGEVLRVLGGGSLPFTGLPLAVSADLVRIAKRLIRRTSRLLKKAAW